MNTVKETAIAGEVRQLNFTWKLDLPLVSATLFHYRRKKGLTLFQFAEKSMVDEDTVARIERAHAKQVRSETMARLSIAMCLPVHVFLKGFGQTYNPELLADMAITRQKMLERGVSDEDVAATC